MSDELTLFSACLLSKWGFNDGNLDDHVYDWIDEHAPDVDYVAVDDKAVLVRLVREHLLPALDQRVEVVEIQTSHNPIRATTVDGLDVEPCWFRGAPASTLTPEYVDVSMSDVLAAIRAAATSRESA